MQLNEVLSMIQKCRIPDLEDNTGFQVIQEEGFYYPAPLTPISQSPDSRFILISAPGAVGKTTLAKHIAYTYGGLYWDVSKKPVGATAFAGEVTHAVGIGKGAKQDEFFYNLKCGKALVILDAFDEAELISKRDGIEDFLLEMNKITKDATSPSIILMARTGMAQYIRSVFQKNSIPSSCYDIDYFEISEAPRFVEAYVRSVGINVTPMLCKQINEYVDHILQRLDRKEDIRSFMGYAQVLSILSRQVEMVCRANSSLDSLYKSGLSQDGQKLIYNIIQELIFRETEKLSTFKAGLRSKYENLGLEYVIDHLYDKQEQLIRLQFFVLSNGSIALDDCPNCSELLPEDRENYLELLEGWLPQHVFLNKDQIMPIFYDYLLAESLLDPNLSLFVEEYQSKLPTRVFLDCYLSLNNGCVNDEHVYYLDMAFSSQAKTGNTAYCDIGPSDDDDNLLGDSGNDLYLTLTSADCKAEANLCVKIIQTSGSAICLSRAENMSVNVSGKVILEQRFLKDVTIRQATIECDQLEFNASEIILEGYNNEESVLIVHRHATRCPNGKIKIKGTPKLKVDFPNADHYRRQFYELAPYFHTFNATQETDECDNIEDFIFSLKKVLEQFKIDNYGGDPAKHKEKIDARCNVGCKLRVLSFLKAVGVIYEDDYLYKASLSAMENFQINRAAYTLFLYDQLRFAYEKYCEWFSAQGFT